MGCNLISLQCSPKIKRPCLSWRLRGSGRLLQNQGTQCMKGGRWCRRVSGPLRKKENEWAGAQGKASLELVRERWHWAIGLLSSFFSALGILVYCWANLVPVHTVHEAQLYMYSKLQNATDGRIVITSKQAVLYKCMLHKDHRDLFKSLLVLEENDCVEY